MNQHHDDAINKAFGALIRSARKRKKLTQQELADQVGLCRTSIVGIENGAQSVNICQLLHMAKALGELPSSLLPYVETPQIPGDRK